MAFAICDLKEPEEIIYDEVCCWCMITIGDFSERFAAPTEIWGLEDYKEQWQRALISINQGAKKAHLVAAMRDPANSDFISTYVLYREGDRVYVQNQIILCEGNEQAIASGNLEKLVEERETETEDGTKISEWSTSLDQIKAFIHPNT